MAALKFTDFASSLKDVDIVSEMKQPKETIEVN